MEIEEDISAIEMDVPGDCSESFGNISCITPENENEKENVHKIETEKSYQRSSMSSEDFSYNVTAVMEVSDLLGLVDKNWSIFRVSPLWNLNFDQSHLNLISKQLNDFLMKHIKTHFKNQKLFSQISVEISTKEVHQEFKALSIDIINKEHTQLYKGVLIKSPNFNEKYKVNNLSDMPILMVQGNKSIIKTVHNFLTDHFDCIIRPYEFAVYQFLWLIAITLGDAGQLYKETILYNYLYKYELSKGQMDVKCYIESEFLRSTLYKLNVNLTSAEATSTFHHSDLMNVQSEIEEHFKLTSGINVSKLKLKEFKAPNVASITTSGKIHIQSANLMDLILNYLMEIESNKSVS